MSKIDIDFITSDDGVLVLGFADEWEPDDWEFLPRYQPVLTRGLCLTPLVAAPLSSPRVALFNISTRRIGGLRFIKVGRFCLSFCITRDYRRL
jgi:hypothetical protein